MSVRCAPGLQSVRILSGDNKKKLLWKGRQLEEQNARLVEEVVRLKQQLAAQIKKKPATPWWKSKTVVEQGCQTEEDVIVDLKPCESRSMSPIDSIADSLVYSAQSDCQNAFQELSIQTTFSLDSILPSSSSSCDQPSLLKDHRTSVASSPLFEPIGTPRKAPTPQIALIRPKTDSGVDGVSCKESATVGTQTPTLAPSALDMEYYTAPRPRGRWTNCSDCKVKDFELSLLRKSNYVLLKRAWQQPQRARRTSIFELPDKIFDDDHQEPECQTCIEREIYPQVCKTCETMLQNYHVAAPSRTSTPPRPISTPSSQFNEPVPSPLTAPLHLIPTGWQILPQAPAASLAGETQPVPVTTTTTTPTTMSPLAQPVQAALRLLMPVSHGHTMVPPNTLYGFYKARQIQEQLSMCAICNRCGQLGHMNHQCRF